MMRTLRKNYKKILLVTSILVIPSFIYWGGAGRMGSRKLGAQMHPTIAATVNGATIPSSSFYDELRDMTDRYREQLGADFDRDIVETFRLQERTMEWLVQRTLLLQQADKLGIKVSRRAIEDHLKSWPLFQTDGKFDPKKWNDYVASKSMPWGTYFARTEQDLKIERLKDEVEQSVTISDADVWDKFKEDNEKRKIRYIEIDPKSFMSEINPTDEDIQKYYDEHKDELKRPEQRKVRFVEKKVELTPEQKQEILKAAKEVLEKARGGADFAELAKENSQDPGSAKNGGELPPFKKGVMDPAFEKAAFNLKPGQISDLVESKYGYHIIQVEETKKDEAGEEEVHARHILFLLQPSDADRDKAREALRAFAEEARKEAGFEAAAEKAGLKVKETGLITQVGDQKLAEDVGAIGAFMVSREAFKLKAVNDISDVADVQNDFFVVQLLEKKDAYLPELAEIRDEVATKVKQLQAEALAKSRADELAASAASLDDLTAQKKYPVSEPKESEAFSRSGAIPGVGRAKEFSNQIFASPMKKLTGPVLAAGKIYFFEVTEEIPADKAKFEKEKKTLRDKLLTTERQKAVQEWLAHLMASAKIVRNESLLTASSPEATA